MNDFQKISTGIFCIVILPLFCIICCFYEPKTVKLTPIKIPTSEQVGEKVGATTRKFGRGFFHGFRNN